MSGVSSVLWLSHRPKKVHQLQIHAFIMFLTPSATISASICRHLLSNGVSTDMKREEKKMDGLRTCSAPSHPLHSSRFLPKSKRRRPPSASLRPHDVVALKRRAFVIAGLSVIPFFQLRSPALADERDDSEIKTSKLIQETEVAVSEGTSSPNTFLSLLNGLGIFSSGVLGALCALDRKDTKLLNKPSNL
ncbi:MAR-binding filament-like protein 1 isoform X2 [Raphanus sativus]|uniref:MAR-binding filament-like protein 1 isoform X2 n=2 Tax=Raphanus sativus TaxID=3726 RepID=A0A6J0K0P9_RAPSA|nr:MAR-binding filament-like protein 1 isoform X2 [Raphanus sativus]